MPIERGEAWGVAGVLPTNAPIVGSDHEAAALVGGDHSVIGVEGGDLALTLGVRAPLDRSTPKQLLAVDAISLQIDGAVHHAIAHVVIGHPLRSSQWFAIMNAAFYRGRNLAPRSHPGDGRLDVLTANLGPTDRLKAWRRAATGTHVPHPGIKIARVTSGEISLERAAPVQIDGQVVGSARALSYQLVPEAITIAVS